MKSSRVYEADLERVARWGRRLEPMPRPLCRSGEANPEACHRRYYYHQAESTSHYKGRQIQLEIP